MIEAAWAGRSPRRAGRPLAGAQLLHGHGRLRREGLGRFRRGKAAVVVDPVDWAVVRLPHRVVRRLDGWALRQLTGS